MLCFVLCRPFVCVCMNVCYVLLYCIIFCTCGIVVLILHNGVHVCKALMSSGKTWWKTLKLLLVLRNIQQSRGLTWNPS